MMVSAGFIHTLFFVSAFSASLPSEVFQELSTAPDKALAARAPANGSAMVQNLKAPAPYDLNILCLEGRVPGPVKFQACNAAWERMPQSRDRYTFANRNDNVPGAIQLPINYWNGECHEKNPFRIEYRPILCNQHACRIRKAVDTLTLPHVAFATTHNCRARGSNTVIFNVP